MGRKIAFWVFVRIPVLFVTASLVLVALLRWVPVKYTPLMMKRAFQCREMEEYHTEQEWVSLENISPELIKAVIAGEDTRYWTHNGFDWVEIRKVMRDAYEDDCPPRGCSTISQQTAKNVFTLGSRSLLRKVIEIWWTVLIEWIWGKERILEVYLNIAETGPGIYGVGAASKIYFDSNPQEVDKYQAASIAACLPSPLTDSPYHLSAAAKCRKKAILLRMGDRQSDIIW